MGNPIAKSKPKTSGRMMLKQFRMPAEWHPHRRCWMLWPYRTDNWKCNAAPAQAAFLQVAKAISNFEPVTMGVRKDQMEKAQKLLGEFKSTNSLKHPIDLVEMESNDAWMRDVGPTFLVPRDPATHKKLLGVDWIFNAWGQKYDDWRNDDAIASQVTDFAQSDRIRADFILEGGSIHVDGEGTILTTEECLLHPNRNHSLTKEQIEERLLNYLGGEKVIWLPQGLVADDDTNGHIDNICCFSKPGQVLLAWTDDVTDAHYPRCQAAIEALQSTTDARGRRLDVVKIPIPPTLFYRPEDFEGITGVDEHGYARENGLRMAGSYVNFYIANGGIVCPSFHPDTDGKAREILQQCFPGYEIVQVPGRDILLGGGNIHCITQQEPMAPA